MDGFVNLLKPPGMTSHDAVRCLRKLLKIKKVGHTGTLDPGVAGVLPICLGKGTRLAEYVTGERKSYRAEITLGIATDSQDAYGAVTRRVDCTDLSYARFLDLLDGFLGNIEQVPPMVSAVRVQGRRLYELAREGIEIERRPRPVIIHEITVVKKSWHMPHPKVIVDLTCSKGTYVRTLCHDLGERLGVGAHMSYLIRTASGPFQIEKSIIFEEIVRLIERNDLSFVQPMQEGIGFMPSIIMDDSQTNSLLHGNPVVLPDHDFPENVLFRAEEREGRLLAVGQVIFNQERAAVFRPDKVLG